MRVPRRAESRSSWPLPRARALVDLGPQALFRRAQLGRELGAEVLGLEHLAKLELDIAVRVARRPALDDLDRLLARADADHREPGDQLLGLGERPVGDERLAVRELHARSFRARLQALAGEHHARL